MSDKIAVIDLGTNTFQMMVAQQKSSGLDIIFQKSTPSRLGKGGINQGLLTQDAIERGIIILQDFRSELSNLRLDSQQIFVFGTSAIRNAVNRETLLQRIQTDIQLPVHVIDGQAEALLIYYGVKQAVNLDHTPQLIMDIGGGSVEFIIADHEKIFWKKSFETGGQRLLDRFVKSDPISPTAIRQINNFLSQELIPLSNAIHQYAPKILIGSSGTFETLAEIEHWRHHNCWPPSFQKGFDIPLESFYHSRNLILNSNREERMLIPGMKELRVDMVGAAICLIDYILNTAPIRSMKASRYSLKEGAALMLIQNNYSIDQLG